MHSRRHVRFFRKIFIRPHFSLCYVTLNYMTLSNGIHSRQQFTSFFGKLFTMDISIGQNSLCENALMSNTISGIRGDRHRHSTFHGIWIIDCVPVKVKKKVMNAFFLQNYGNFEPQIAVLKHPCQSGHSKTMHRKWT